MKSNIFVKILISLSICLLTASFSVSVFADEGEWTNFTGESVTAPDGSVYYAYDVPANYYLNLWDRKDLQYSFWTNSARITSYGKEEKVVFVNFDHEKYFTTKEYKATLDEYFAGNGGEYFLSDKSINVGVAYENVASVRARYQSDAKVTVDVTTLKDAFSGRAILVDESYNFSYIVGEFYYFESENIVYYVDFDALENNAFDADGNLSYRSGKIQMLKLSSSERSAYLRSRSTFSSFTYSLFEHENSDSDYYEYDGGYGCNRTYSTFGTHAFWTVTFGIALPLMITVWTAVLLIRKRHDDYKQLFFILVPAALWLVAGIIVFVLIL